MKFDYEYDAIQRFKDNVAEDKLDPEYKHVRFNQKFMKSK